MSIFKCKKCENEYEADVQTLAPKTHKCPKCGEINGREQNTRRNKYGWETPSK
ncbi:zinc-ribbon domain-containing protein [Alkaliphilus sp. B6464]|uniref:zinc-ribbon domain-containing protein n=1 Tax=Alkaliphilus sp. B6464 TaxID=2731219 RepID=UPI001BAB3A5B|nr:hypothetical protein [Alkaliphilus sp. B6464]QUH22103.1 hypothetical protein HYG84_19545 [Alkaliphilus sp. B6464]